MYRYGRSSDDVRSGMNSVYIGTPCIHGLRQMYAFWRYHKRSYAFGEHNLLRRSYTLRLIYALQRRIEPKSSKNMNRNNR